MNSVRSGWFWSSPPRGLRARAPRQIRHAGRGLRVRLERAVLGRHGDSSHGHSSPQANGQHRLAGPPGPAAHEEAAGQDGRAEGSVPRLHRDVQVLQSGTGGPGGLRRPLPPVQHQADEEGEGPGREGLQPDQAQPAGEDGSARHLGTRIGTHCESTCICACRDRGLLQRGC